MIRITRSILIFPALTTVCRGRFGFYGYEEAPAGATRLGGLYRRRGWGMRPTYCAM